MFTAKVKSILGASLLAISSFSFAANIDMNADVNDLAIKGYDPVSYFTKSKAIEGNVNYTSTFKGAIYRFSNAKNRDMFKAAPYKYAPQYGGYCAFGVTKMKKFDTDPLAWKIVDNKLYLNLNKGVQKRWLSDVPGFLSESEEYWPNIKNTQVDKL